MAGRAGFEPAWGKTPPTKQAGALGLYAISPILTILVKLNYTYKCIKIFIRKMIKIKIKFFAKLKEDIGHKSFILSLEKPQRVIDIINIISKDFDLDILSRNNYLFA